MGFLPDPFQSQAGASVFYKGRELRKTYIPDLFVFGGIVVELKSVKNLLPEHEAQLLNYLRITKMAVGYLINFGAAREVEWKRFILREFVPDNLKKETA